MISILMPVKNEENHLVDALNSIHNQTHEDFELIAVDDNSSDRSFSILCEFASRDPRIKAFRNPDAGIITALQFAHSKASGDFITRQDADDLMPEKKLEVLLHLLKKVGRGNVVTGLVEYFSNTQLKEGFKNYGIWLNSLCEKNSHYEEIFKECVLVSSNWLMFQEDFKSIEGFNNAIYPEDYHFVFKLYERNFNIHSVNTITHLWRDHQDRASRNLEQYRDQKFFPLKVQYFKKLLGPHKVCLWGAGPTGKKLARELIAQGVCFYWVTNNERKIGKFIYGVEVFDFKTLVDKTDHRLIISVTQRDSIVSIMEFLTEIDLKEHYRF